MRALEITVLSSDGKASEKMQAGPVHAPGGVWIRAQNGR
jgi:hypothetical protein